MFPPARVALFDGGATDFKGELADVIPGLSFPEVTSLATATFPATKKPNDPVEDYAKLVGVLRKWKRRYGFSAIVIGLAARVRFDGMIARGGSLNWHDRDLGAMLKADFPGVEVFVANDGVMYAAYELVFGALKDQKYQGNTFLVAAPGTGIATALGIWHGNGWRLAASEIQHAPYDRAKEPNGCNCGCFCIESAASGGAFERMGIDVATLDEPTDVGLMAPPLGALVALSVRQLASDLSLVVIAGGLAHKRTTLIGAVEAAAAADLGGFVETPQFLLGSSRSGGIRGALSYWVLQASS